MNLRKNCKSWWILMALISLCECYSSRYSARHPPSNSWPQYEGMPLHKALKILQSLGVGIDTEEEVKSVLGSQDELSTAYETVLQFLIVEAGHCHRQEKYRRADGVCNNLANPLWGASLHIQRRIIAPAYDDGRGIPRLVATNGEYLPSTRTLSLQCFPPNQEIDEDLDKETTQMVMQFGQYIDHDLVFTEVSDGTGCCNFVDRGFLHPDVLSGGPCFPIDIQSEPRDRYFNGSCMPFKRSFPVISKNVREQINGISSYIDASSVYGSNIHEHRTLREMVGGRLKVSAGNMLPIQGSSKCDPGEAHGCPQSGKTERNLASAAVQRCQGNRRDTRVSVFPGLTVLHTIFHREHNRIANKLAALKNGWDDEILFQEARKIVIALHQKIVYDEYLPVVLGAKVMDIFDIDKPYEYKHDLDASILNSFAAAAFRYGHTQINSILKINGTYHPISNVFFKSHLAMKENVIKEIITEQARNFAQQVNEKVTTEVSDKLFLGFDAPNLSTDLMARNIQRGRDHGLPSYFHYFDRCRERMSYRLTVPELTLPSCLNSRVYKHVNDIDLFVGGMHEQHVEGGLVGPTFACLIGEQFWRLKFGDRFFYETNNADLGFTTDQLDEIRKTSFSSILCYNSKVRKLQPNVFKPYRTPGNALIPCIQYEDMDFSKWKVSEEDN